MAEFFIEPVSLANIEAVYPDAMLSLFWEQGMEQIRNTTALPHFPTADGKSGAPHADLRPQSPDSPTVAGEDTSKTSKGDLERNLDEQVRLEKEAWLNTVFLSWGPCGFSLRRKPSRTSGSDVPETVGTLLFAPPRFCPTTFSMPSGPISPDAIALTSLHYNPLEVESDMLRTLITRTLHKLSLRGISAVEAFGCSGTSDSVTAPLPSPDALDDGTENLIADFEEQLEERLNPRPCVSEKLGAINHEAGDLIRTRTLLDAGFRVVTPDPIHPKLRIELDAELDWDEEMGHALDVSAKEPFMRSKLFSL